VGDVYEVQIAIESPVALGSVQFAVTESLADGSFQGGGSNVACEALDSGALAEFYEADDVLYAAVLDVTNGLSGPTAIAICRYTTLGTVPTESSFHIELVEAYDEQLSETENVELTIAAISSAQ
jgi:hypothetical protein